MKNSHQYSVDVVTPGLGGGTQQLVIFRLPKEKWLALRKVSTDLQDELGGDLRMSRDELRRRLDELRAFMALHRLGEAQDRDLRALWEKEKERGLMSRWGASFLISVPSTSRVGEGQSATFLYQFRLDTGELRGFPFHECPLDETVVFVGLRMVG